MKVFVCGDTHGSIDISKLSTKLWPEQKSLTKEDIVIILGDFGFIWEASMSGEELWWLNWLCNKPFQVCFIDGNHCLAKDTEVLTENGWINIEKVYNDKGSIKLANMDLRTNLIEYDTPIKKIRSFKDKVVNISSTNVKQNVSLDHDLIIRNKKVKASDIIGKAVKESDFTLFGTSDSAVAIDDNMLRLLVWVIMDGTMVDYSKYTPNSKKKRIQFKLSKQRKIDSLCKLLDDMGYPYTIKEATKCGENKLQPYYIRIYSDWARTIWNALDGKKEIPSEWRNLSLGQSIVFFETLSVTDGTIVEHNGNNPLSWTTTSKHDLDVVQEICVKNNKYCKFSTRTRSGFTASIKKMQYNLMIQDVKWNKYSSQNVDIAINDYKDYMYCFQMPHGTLITRTSGTVVITGNCNFDRLNNPDNRVMKDFHGDTAQVVYETKNGSVLRLGRGSIYDFQGSKVLTLGGAESTDRQFRSEYISWWKEESISDRNYYTTMDNLNDYDNIVDFVLTHTCPQFMVEHFIMFCQKWQSQIQLEEIENQLTYKEWHFGHFHLDAKVENFHCHYNNTPYQII